MERAVIFDMDGVIIDSNPFHKISWSNFLRRHGVPVNDEIFKNVIFGTTGNETIRALIDPNLSQEEVDRYNDEVDEEYRGILQQQEGITPVKGFMVFLDELKNTGFQIAVATSAPPENVSQVLSIFNLHKDFDLIVDKTQVVNGKPNPEIYLTTVKQLDVAKKDCVVFEDSIAGISSGVGAGLVVVGLATSHSHAELLSAGASQVIDDFSNFSVASLNELMNGSE